jgi:hypothetical protein
MRAVILVAVAQFDKPPCASRTAVSSLSILALPVAGVEELLTRDQAVLDRVDRHFLEGDALPWLHSSTKRAATACTLIGDVCWGLAGALGCCTVAVDIVVPWW